MVENQMDSSDKGTTKTKLKKNQLINCSILKVLRDKDSGHQRGKGKHQNMQENHMFRQNNEYA